MKKFLALVMSVVMLVSVISAMDVSAFAEEQTTTLTIGSNIIGAQENDVQYYYVMVDGVGFDGQAVGKDGKTIYEVVYGYLWGLPLNDTATIEIPYGSEFAITADPIEKPGYNKIEGKTIEGYTEKYVYSEDYALGNKYVHNELTYDEYCQKTNNGINDTAYFYYDAENDKMYDESELVTGKYYSESIANESEAEIGFVEGTQTELPVSVQITSKYNVNQPLTSIGRKTYNYSGKVTVLIGEKTYEQDYTTVPATDSSSAMTNAIRIIETAVRTLVVQATTEITNGKDTSAYFTDSLDGMLPKAMDMPTGSNEVKIVDSKTKLVECKPFEKSTIYYLMDQKTSGEFAIFDGRLVEEHEHNFVKSKIVDPTCVAEGYTIYECDFKNCTGTENRDIIPVNEENHNFNYKSNSDGVTPTCTEAGKLSSQTGTCEYCGKVNVVEGREIPAKGHFSVSANNAKPATCTEAGKESDMKCLYCGITLTEGAVIPATGHSYDAGKVTTKETCGKDGVKTLTCKTCKATKTEKIPATGNHNYTVTVSKAPTATKAGTLKSTCKNCGKVKTQSIAKIAKTSISKLTATKKGYKVSWKKVSSSTGYQLQHSNSKKFTNPRTYTISKNSTVSKSVSNLKAGKKYYVRIRTYRVVNGKKYYSAWSAVKTVTPKK